MVYHPEHYIELTFTAAIKNHLITKLFPCNLPVTAINLFNKSASPSEKIKIFGDT